METAVYVLNQASLATDILALAETFPFERIYFGSESCERLTPGEDELAAFLKEVSRLGVAGTFVTPTNVSDDALNELDGRFAFLEACPDVDEVVFNDWGVLEVLSGHRGLAPVLGRALNRMKRDPRIEPSHFNGREAEVLRSANLTNESYVRFLRAKGVGRAEYDNVPQGVDASSVPDALRASLHYPAVPVAFLSHCVIGATRRHGREKYALDGRCRRECAEYFVSMPRLGVLMIQKATYMLNESLEHVDLGAFDRVVRVVI